MIMLAGGCSMYVGAAAVVVGVLALKQRPTPIELLGIALVVLAVSIRDTTEEPTRSHYPPKWTVERS